MIMATLSPKLFLLVLTCFVSVSSFTASQETMVSSKDGARVGAELEPYEKYSVEEAEGGPKSALFSKCLEESRTADVKLFSIEVTGGEEFVRFVPDTYLKSFNVAWTEVPKVNIASIMDCADAADVVGAAMFKYQEGVCQVTSMSYDFNTAPSCDNTETEAVFILPEKASCYIPEFQITLEGAKSVWCARVVSTGDIAIANITDDVCPDGKLYTKDPTDPNFVHRDDLVQLMTDLGVLTDLVTAAKWGPLNDEMRDSWNYDGDVEVSISDMIGGALPSSVSSGDTNGFLVMRADSNLLFEQQEETEVIGHALCMFM